MSLYNQPRLIRKTLGASLIDIPATERPANILMTNEGPETAQTDRHLKSIKMSVFRLWHGFEEHSISELNRYVFRPVNYKYRSEAAWQLAVWYICFEGKEAAEKALPYFDILAENPGTRINPVNVAILRTEALIRIGRWSDARNFCLDALHRFGGQDLMLACANLFAYPECPLPHDTCERLRLDWINRALREAGLEEFHLIEPDKGLNIDNIAGPDNLPDPGSGRALVTVIVAAYNAEQFIGTALRSLQAQSWRNLEILVVDDSSRDNTCEIVSEISKKDSRVRLIRSDRNGGDSYARNLALAEAKGDFVTLLDADDFAHPRKIEIQAEDLIQRPDIIANRSNHMRADYYLKLDRKAWFTGLRPNFSALMFRRKPVVDEIGYWDSVRITGDAEFFARMKIVFGREKVFDIPTGLLGLSRQMPGSLTGQTGPGRTGFLYGVRREYNDAFRQWHRSGAKLYIDFPMKERPFAVPKMLELDTPQVAGRVDHYDVIYAADFRLDGGTTTASIEEIRANSANSISTGIMRLDWIRVRPNLPFDRKFRKLLNDGSARLMAYPEEAETELVIITHPPCALFRRSWTPKIRTKKAIIVCSQTPLRGEGKLADRIYYPEEVDRRVIEQFGVRGEWHPVGPVARRALEAENADIFIAPDDWRHVIDVDEWSDGREGPVNPRPAIGRHGRDHYSKWPETPEMILRVYPEREDIDVVMLGGAKTPAGLLGHLPSNWTVHEFDSIHPRDYLKLLDVFVYFPHSEYHETFGLTIIEAMAVGVPVILSKFFRETFGEAAFYCEPAEAADLAKGLCLNVDEYRERMAAGRDFVREYHSREMHIQMLKKIIGQDSHT